MSIKTYYQNFYKPQVILLIFFLLLGCYFRFANLNSKIFWVDEISTTVRVSGYTIPEVSQSLQQQDILSFDDLLAYQVQSRDRTFGDTWSALTKSPEHAPLYFVLTRIWVQLWGSSIAVMRSLSVAISLLVFPALYWLCQELFARPSISRMAVILMSVSPFYVAYAQEARPYSLWTVTILLMSASLIRAIRLNTLPAWLLYSFCLVLGLYTSLFSVYLAAFQGIYLLLISIKNKFKIIRNYLLSSLLSLLLFSPWIIIIINHIDLLQKNTEWMRGNFNIAEIIAVFIGTVLLIFGDLPIAQDSDPVKIVMVLIFMVIAILAGLKGSYLKTKPILFGLLLTFSSSIFLILNYQDLDLVGIIGAVVALGILTLSSYSLYYLISNANRDCEASQRHRWLYILCLMLSLPLPLLVIDIINQGQGSTAPRYLIPLQLGIQIAVAYTLINKLAIHKKQKFWQTVIISFLILGIFSCTRNLNLSPFYQKGRNINNPAIAKIINRSNSPLVVIEADEAMDALSLAYSLSPQTKYKIINRDRDITEYSDRFTDIFILRPSVALQTQLQTKPDLKLKQVYKSHLFSADEIPLNLWSIDKF